VLENNQQVVALGGGAVVAGENQRMIKEAGCRVVYLSCPAEILYQRIHLDPNTAANRPSLTALGGGLEEVKAKLAEREPIYHRVADLVTDVGRTSPDQAAEEIARWILENKQPQPQTENPQ
jgi:shikimate kinase